MKDLFLRIPEEKRLRILRSAVAEFARNGYESANTNRIAKSAGVSVGSLFQYFDNKEDLFLSTVEFGSAELEKELSSLADLGAEADFFQNVENVLRTVQRHSRENPDLIRLYNEMTSQDSMPLVAKQVAWIETSTSSLYRKLLDKAKRDGLVRQDCDSGVFAFLLDNLFMMLQFSYTCDYYKERFKLYTGPEVLDRDDFVVEEAMKFIRAAFRPEKTGG